MYDLCSEKLLATIVIAAKRKVFHNLTFAECCGACYMDVQVSNLPLLN